MASYSALHKTGITKDLMAELKAIVSATGSATYQEI